MKNVVRVEKHVWHVYRSTKLTEYNVLKNKDPEPSWERECEVGSEQEARHVCTTLLQVPNTLGVYFRKETKCEWVEGEEA